MNECIVQVDGQEILQSAKFYCLNKSFIKMEVLRKARFINCGEIVKMVNAS